MHPKKWLSPGVWTIPTSTPADTRVDVNTTGLVPPMTAVCPSWVPTKAASATVLARREVPVGRASSQAPVAPAAVVAARRAIWVARAPPSEASGPS